MSLDRSDTLRLVYKVVDEDGRSHLVYNASVIGNPAGHVPDKWYTRPYPVMVTHERYRGEPYDTAEQAERSIGARPRDGSA